MKTHLKRWRRLYDWRLTLSGLKSGCYIEITRVTRTATAGDFMAHSPI
jgi:hypothetical protein